MKNISRIFLGVAFTLSLVMNTLLFMRMMKMEKRIDEIGGDVVQVDDMLENVGDSLTAIEERGHFKTDAGYKFYLKMKSKGR